MIALTGAAQRAALWIRVIETAPREAERGVATPTRQTSNSSAKRTRASPMGANESGLPRSVLGSTWS